MELEFETKTDRRAKKRHKNRTSHVGVPLSKIRLTTEEELRAKWRRVRRKTKENDKERQV